MKGVEVSPLASEHGDEDKVTQEAEDDHDEKYWALQPPLQILQILHCIFILIHYDVVITHEPKWLYGFIIWIAFCLHPIQASQLYVSISRYKGDFLIVTH